MPLTPLVKNRGQLLTSEILGALDVIPEEFRANVGILITDQEVPVDVGPDDVISDGLLQESRVTQTRTNERKKINTSFLAPPTDSLVSFIKTPDGQTATLTRTLVPPGTPLPVDAETYEARQRNLGNGFLDQEVVEAPIVFPAAHYGIEIPDIIPAKFRVAIPTETSELTSEGQADSTPTLNVGELAHEETNVDIWKKRVKSTFRPSIALPVSLTDTVLDGIEHGGSKFNSTVSRIGTLNNGQQSIDLNFLSYRSEVDNLGNGQSLKSTDTIDAYPTLTDNLIERSTGIISNRVKTVVPAGTACPAGSQQLAYDRGRTIRMTETVDPASLAAVGWAFPGSTSVNVPPELTSITVYPTGNASAGNYNESGSYGLSGHGSGGVSLRGHASGSASALYEVGYTVKESWGNNVPCIHVIFYAAQNSSRASLISRASSIAGVSASDWPRFVPQGIVVVLLGGKTNVGIELSATAYDTCTVDFNGDIVLSGSNRTGGLGFSFDFGSSTKAVRIPPTIHAALSVQGGTSFTQSFASNSSISTGANSQAGSISGSASAIVSTTSFPATPGQATIPTSGNFVHRITTEPYIPGTIMVHIEIVNFADFSG